VALGLLSCSNAGSGGAGDEDFASETAFTTETAAPAVNTPTANADQNTEAATNTPEPPPPESVSESTAAPSTVNDNNNYIIGEVCDIPFFLTREEPVTIAEKLNAIGIDVPRYWVFAGFNRGEIILRFNKELATANAALYAEDLIVKRGDNVLTPSTDYITEVDGDRLVIKINGAAEFLHSVQSKNEITYIEDRYGNKAAPFTHPSEVMVVINDGPIYFVDNTNPRAGNMNPGTEEEPWRSITIALGRLRPGDTLYIRGEYHGQDAMFQAGTLRGEEGNWISIRSYPGERALLSGLGPHTGRSKIMGGQYVLFSGFAITNQNHGLFVESNGDIKSTHVILDNLHVFATGQEAVKVWDNSSFVTVQNSVIHDAGVWRDNSNGEGIYTGQGSGGTFTDNTNHLHARNNLIYNTKCEGIDIKSGTHDFLVENNIFYNNNTNHSFDVGAIEISSNRLVLQVYEGNPNHVVRNNIVFGQTNVGILVDTGTTVYNNIVFDIESRYAGILLRNPVRDNFVRNIFNNTVYLPPEQAIRNGANVTAANFDIRNNLGPDFGENMPVEDDYFVDAGARDFRLVAGSAPIDAGGDVGVGVDFLGVSRPQGSGFDYGAFEFAE
jgi:hypothetical protein